MRPRATSEITIAEFRRLALGCFLAHDSIVKIVRTIGGAAAAIVVATAPRLAAAHGPPAFVSGIVAEDSQGPLVVSLSEGLGMRVDSTWRFVCPAPFGGELSPPALSADGLRTYVVGQNDLFALDPGGRVLALRRPELSRDSVLSLATTGGRLFATRLAGDRTELWRVDDSSGGPIWQGAGVYAPLSADSSGLWMVHQTGGSAEAVHLGIDGSLTESRTFEIDQGSSVSTILLATGALYVNIVTPSLGAELVRIDGADGGASVVAKPATPLSGPVSDGAGAAWIATGDVLFHVSGSDAQTVFSHGERFISVGSYEDTVYASLQTRLVELGASGPGRDLFHLADVQEPLLDAVSADLRDACHVQWLVFRGDLARVGIVSDAGMPEADTGGSARTSASSGCSEARVSGSRTTDSRALGALSVLLLPFLLSRVALRRRVSRKDGLLG